MLSKLLITKIFQSTLPRVERQHYLKYHQHSLHFNPRSREWSDFSQPSAKNVTLHFNPRSREWSDGCIFYLLHCRRSDFNPRSREWSDSGCKKILSALWNFNPRSREWSDRRLRSPALCCLRFQSTLPRVERRLICSRV